MLSLVVGYGLLCGNGDAGVPVKPIGGLIEELKQSNAPQLQTSALPIRSAFSTSLDHASG